MPKLTELTSASTLANSDLLVVTTNTSGTAVSNSVNVATLATAVSVATPIIRTLIGDSGNIVASNTSTEITLAGGTALTTNVSGNTITFNVNSSALSNTITTIATPNGNVVSDNAIAFALNTTGSNGVIISASGNTVDITFNPNTINSLTDLYNPTYGDEASLPANASIYDGGVTVAGGDLYHGHASTFIRNINVEDSADELKSHVKFTVGESGGNYTFSGGGAQGSGNETLYLYKGMTYQFDANSVYGSHPFELRVSDGGAAFGNGVTTTDGRVYFTVPMNAANLVYQCTSHSGMLGTLVIVT
jgi:hypothetical protein